MADLASRPQNIETLQNAGREGINSRFFRINNLELLIKLMPIFEYLAALESEDLTAY